ncbi:amidase signature domain-containing protein [Aspergillus californicus]
MVAMQGLFAIIGLLLLCRPTLVSAIESQGVSVTMQGVPYWINPSNVISAPGLVQDDSSKAVHGYIPVTIIHSPVTEFTSWTLKRTVSAFLETDDVFNERFLQETIVAHVDNYGLSRSKVDVKVSPKTIKKYEISTVAWKDLTTYSKVIPPGPYFYQLSTGTLHQAYRLYSDSQLAFTAGLVPTSHGSFIELPASVPGAAAMTVGVPSRLYFSPSADAPLAGVRIGVKDIFDIKGVKTGAGNRAYYDIYPSATVHSNPVQRLIDAGAVIVGKMKTAQFAAPENAIDAIDYQTPFNPRGDGYQQPSSSSSGSGAGIASYHWLDLTLGSDTGGSVRFPSNFNGVFGNRPTHGLVDLTGVVSLASAYDTAGLLARDPFLWSAAADVLYGGLDKSSSYPKKIQTFNFPNGTSDASSAQRNIATSFLNDLASYLSADVSTLDYTSLWKETHPETDLESDLLGLTWIIPCAQEQAATVRDPFYAEYAAKYHNRTPFVNPSTLATWEFGDQFEPRIDEAIRNKTIFMDWWSENVIQRNEETCSDSIVVYIGTDAVPGYINTYGDFIGTLDSFQPSFLSVFAEQPEYVLPIGEASYHSDVTTHVEKLPVTVNIMAARGCDGMLFQLVEDLAREGIVSSVQPGSTIRGGDIYI